MNNFIIEIIFYIGILFFSPYVTLFLISFKINTIILISILITTILFFSIKSRKKLPKKIFYFLSLIFLYADILKRESIIDPFYFGILFYFSVTFFVYFVIKDIFIKLTEYTKLKFIDREKNENK